MRIVIVGGVAGGASAAARARRLDETAEIILLQSGPDVSFGKFCVLFWRERGLVFLLSLVFTFTNIT